MNPFFWMNGLRLAGHGLSQVTIGLLQDKAAYGV